MTGVQPTAVSNEGRALSVLGGKVRAARRRLGLSREQLGVAAQRSGRTIARIETATCEYQPKLDTVEAIAKVLGMKTTDLLGDDLATDAA